MSLMRHLHTGLEGDQARSVGASSFWKDHYLEADKKEGVSAEGLSMDLCVLSPAGRCGKCSASRGLFPTSIHQGDQA